MRNVYNCTNPEKNTNLNSVLHTHYNTQIKLPVNESEALAADNAYNETIIEYLTPPKCDQSEFSFFK